MGIIVSARCTCGYHADQLLLGIGMQGYSYQLAQCSHCREVVSINADAARARCPGCRRAPKSYSVVEPSDLADDTDQPIYECPQCQRISLKFEHAGLWD